MKHDPRLDVIRRALRQRICTRCQQRPAGSETLSAQTPRACEGDCSIFRSIPRLELVLELKGKAALEPPETAVRNLICLVCHASPSAGDYCTEHLARTCPLARYETDVVDVLEQLAEHLPLPPSPPASETPV